jgi:trk system potassium uptake protein
MKCLRVMLCFKYCYKELFSLMHPHAVTHIKIGGKSVPEDVMRSVLGFLALYMGLFAFVRGPSGRSGGRFHDRHLRGCRHHRQHRPRFRHGGPVENFAHIPVLGKWLLIWCMLLGRLEIFTVIILLVPEFWRK